MTKLRDVLSDKWKWTQYAMARDEYGKPVRTQSQEACSFCLVGGLDRLYITSEERETKLLKIVDYIRARQDSYRFLVPSTTSNSFNLKVSVSNFNDGVDWPQIDEMLDKLDL